MPDFTLSVTGKNFVTGSKIIFNGTLKNTTYVSALELTCLINSADIALNSFLPSIAIDNSGNINVIWPDGTLGNYEIFLSSSTR